jgi:hypothetical protein
VRFKVLTAVTILMFFWVKSPSSALKMDTARFSETLASTNQSTRRLNPEEHHHKSKHVINKYFVQILCNNVSKY